MQTGLASIKALIIDMDGVIYRGKAALPGSVALFRFLEERGIKYRAVTNNATVSQDMVVEKLGGLGIKVSRESIMTSGAATAAYLAENAPLGSSVFVVGEESLEQEMVKHGLRLAGRDADYVVVGLDKTVTFEKLKTATIAIRNGAKFIGTNPDKTYPLENDIIPGAGSIIAAVAAATDQEPFYIGKPEPAIFLQTLRDLKVEPCEAASLGDRLETDILGGYRLGMTTILVLTGISTRQEAEQFSIKPDFTFDNLPGLLEAWENALDT